MLGRRQALQCVGGLELDELGHPGTLGVALGKVSHAKGHVAGKNGHRRGVLTGARRVLQA